MYQVIKTHLISQGKSHIARLALFSAGLVVGGVYLSNDCIIKRNDMLYSTSKENNLVMHLQHYYKDQVTALELEARELQEQYNKASDKEKQAIVTKVAAYYTRPYTRINVFNRGMVVLNIPNKSGIIMDMADWILIHGTWVKILYQAGVLNCVRNTNESSQSHVENIVRECTLNKQ
jgi:hypothetical protein